MAHEVKIFTWRLSMADEVNGETERAERRLASLLDDGYEITSTVACERGGGVVVVVVYTLVQRPRAVPRAASVRVDDLEGDEARP